jgi:hypothetical protein
MKEINPPAIVRPAEDLVALARRINAREEEMVGSVLEHARAQGEDLLRAKKACGHGKWLPWLEANLRRVKKRQAQNYMRVARDWGRIKNAVNCVSGIEDAIRLLTEDVEEEDGEQGPSDDRAAAPTPSDASPWKPTPFLEWSPEERRETAARWWDILAAYTLLLDVQGWSAARIAEVWSVPVEDVDLILCPTPPADRFANEITGAGLFGRDQEAVERCYRNTVQSHIAGALSHACDVAVFVAQNEGWAEAGNEVEAIRRNHERRRDHLKGQDLFSLRWRGDQGVALYCCAMTDARHALGVERNTTKHFIFLFCHFMSLLKSRPWPGKRRRRGRATHDA